jgi:C4-type Zn-finger protein
MNDKEKQIKLKPCPFCGGKAKLVKYSQELPFSEEINYFEIACTKCGIRPYHTEQVNLYYKSDWKEIEEKLICEVSEKWNRRINNG